MRAATDSLGASVASRRRSFEWSDPADSLERADRLSGLEVMRAIIAGELPPPPIARLLAMEVIEVAPGRAVFALEPQEWMYNPIGSVHGGVAATILDSCMGCAVHTTLEAGVGYTTTDLQVRYLRSMRAGGGRVLARGAGRARGPPHRDGRGSHLPGGRRAGAVRPRVDRLRDPAQLTGTASQ